ncbi:MAG: carboxypeptidase-like regulatory domain-containing protein, partial [Sphingobacteriales bacterium]
MKRLQPNTFMMRLLRRSIILLYLLAGFYAFGGTHAQEITISLESVELKKAIVETEKQTVLRFLYNEATIPADKKVNIQARKMPVNEFLSRMFQGTGVQYKIMENNLVVLTAPGTTMSVLAERQVEGRVTDEAGNPLSGASVLVKGTQQGTVTDANGNFTLKVPDNGTIQISAVGYETQDIATAGRTDFNIVLKQRVQTQEQIVVIGYGTARKKDLTGSSVSIKGSDIANLPVLTATQAIQGRAAGVQV